MYITQGLHRGMQQNSGSVMTVSGNRRRTFSMVAARVARLAGALRSLGLCPGDRVAILALNSDRYHEYLLAVVWAGGVVNPINVRWSSAEITYALHDSHTEILFIDEKHIKLTDELRHPVTPVRTVIYCDDGPAPEGTRSYEQLIAEGDPVEDAVRHGDDLAGIFYTGGTTGVPKGVMLSHTNLLASALGASASGYWLASGARLLHAAPMFHLADLAGWAAQLLLGGAHVFVPSFDPDTVMTEIAAQQVTDVILVPTMIQALVDHPNLRRHDLTGLRRLYYGGSPISEALLQRTLRRLPGVELVQCYGMTELGPIATLLGPEDHSTASGRLRSAGRAQPHIQLRVVDSHGNDVAPGEVGEIIVRGPSVTSGYWNKPEETAAVLQQGWLHSGDGAYLDSDGYLYIVDRVKDMIVTGGENVYSVEVENAIATHPLVAQCAVIGLPDEFWGELVHAVIVLTPGADVSPIDIRDHAKALIAGYKAPRSVEFVESLPMSGAGKVLKRQLRDQYLR